MGKATTIAEAITALTMTLVIFWDAIYEEQGGGRRLQSAGSILWSREWGWSVAPHSARQAYYAGYINLADAARKHREIEQCLQRLVEACW